MLKTTALCGKSNKHGGSFPHMPFKQTMLSGKIYWHHFQWQRVLLHYAKNSKCKNLIQSRLADLDYMLIMILKIYLRKGKKNIYFAFMHILCSKTDKYEESRVLSTPGYARLRASQMQDALELLEVQSFRFSNLLNLHYISAQFQHFTDSSPNMTFLLLHTLLKGKNK